MLKKKVGGSCILVGVGGAGEGHMGGKEGR
jgi:hypothetical protein